MASVQQYSYVLNFKFFVAVRFFKLYILWDSRITYMKAYHTLKSPRNSLSEHASKKERGDNEDTLITILYVAVGYEMLNDWQLGLKWYQVTQLLVLVTLDSHTYTR